ncbi:hypothetical protein [Virgisporangium aurantiacum]|uniref:hypothetical protein n=1 Tax=Virgisporangium aurantiacum TaxID=175570 RepID=UPI00194F5388|nr:hypothetical protein [Virgisporangium aurantiacum]
MAAFVLVCCCGGYAGLYFYESSYVPGQREDLLRSFGAPEGFGLVYRKTEKKGSVAKYSLSCAPASVCPPDPVGRLATWATRVGVSGVTGPALAARFQQNLAWREFEIPNGDFEIDVTMSGGVAVDASQALFEAVILITEGCPTCG